MDLAAFDPLVADWFRRRFSAPTEPQALGWPPIRDGRDVLIAAPTGSGKTLAAFLISLDGLVKEARSGPLPDCIHAVYVSPLRALSNDIRRNLEIPLAEISAMDASQGVSLSAIRLGLRTGDTAALDRRRMV